jgi:hypothetical protein
MQEAKLDLVKIIKNIPRAGLEAALFGSIPISIATMVMGVGAFFLAEDPEVPYYLLKAGGVGAISGSGLSVLYCGFCAKRAKAGDHGLAIEKISREIGRYLNVKKKKQRDKIQYD